MFCGDAVERGRQEVNTESTTTATTTSSGSHQQTDVRSNYSHKYLLSQCSSVCHADPVKWVGAVRRALPAKDALAALHSRRGQQSFPLPTHHPIHHLSTHPLSTHPLDPPPIPYPRPLRCFPRCASSLTTTSARCSEGSSGTRSDSG